MRAVLDLDRHVAQRLEVVQPFLVDRGLSGAPETSEMTAAQ